MTPFGDLELTFNNSIQVIDKSDLNKSSVHITLQLGLRDGCKEDLNFTWSVIETTSNRITFKFKFKKPIDVSTGHFRDYLIVMFKKPILKEIDGTLIDKRFYYYG